MSILVYFITILIIIFTCKPLIKWYKKRYRIINLVNKIPGPKAYPLIGTTYIFFGVERENISSVIQEYNKKFPHISRDYFGPVPQIELKKAEHIEKILSSGKSHLQKAWFYKFFKLWLGDGLLLSNGEKWFKHRRIITPTFHFTILESFCEIFGEKTQIMVKKLEKFANTGDSFDICPFITKCTLDIIATAAMGTELNAQDEVENEYVQCVFEISEMIFKRMISPWLFSDYIYLLTSQGKKFQQKLLIIHKFAQDVIEQRKNNNRRIISNTKISNTNDTATTGDDNDDINLFGKKKRLVFLDLLLNENEKSNELSDQDIREEVDTFMFAGHDTTTSSISWTLYMLALHPEIQENCFQELNKIFQDSDRVATINDFNSMKLLECVIKETLRLYPPVPVIGRNLSEDVIIEQYILPAGCAVSIEIEHLHKDERYFPDPEKFDPNRFLPENSIGRHPYAYLPFSAGARNCIGQKFAMYEEKSIISSLIRNYRFTTNVRREDMKHVFELILKPINGIPLIFEKRAK